MTEKEVINSLKNGGVGVFPTDTLYGLVGKALLENAVERIYKIKGRTPEKPLIILISNVEELKLFGVKNTVEINEMLKRVWPGETSVVLPIGQNNFEYLDRGTKNLAFRLPKKESLVNVIKETGPLVAPSANPEGQEPAKSINEAKEYFGDKVDFYVDGGELSSESSTLINVEKGEVVVLRQGKVRIDL